MKINTQYLKSEMAKRSMSAYDLAQKTGKRESWIYAILNGKAGKSFATVEIISKALNVDPLKLVTK